ncbi:MAG: MerR family DNA-binding transcriptional regulator [Chloroflexota bacterium]|nr:MerR family DNA-binding transcriptional regulator [Chloroflexota bacterium]
MDEQANEFIGIGPLAEQLGVSRSAVRQWEAKGWIEPAPRLVGSDRRVYLVNDLERIRQRVSEKRSAVRQQGDRASVA